MCRSSWPNEAWESATKLLLTTNDLILLSFAQSLLKDGRIESIVLDANASVMDGSLGMLPRRLMVEDEDYPEAEEILREALKSSLPNAIEDA